MTHNESIKTFAEITKHLELEDERLKACAPPPVVLVVTVDRPKGNNFIRGKRKNLHSSKKLGTRGGIAKKQSKAKGTVTDKMTRLTCYNCMPKGRFAWECPEPAKKESNVKRVKTSNSSDENGSSKAEVESSLAGGKQCAEKQAQLPKDCIHVRARRGQATDSHSLAERARRQKISERMKILQDLVPGCSKVIGKALVLDEIINYVRSLQQQVEFLSMKLEAVTSGMIPLINGFHSKEIKQLALPPFDASGMMFGAQAESESAAAGGPSAGAQVEWLHMQLGGSFERTA